MRGKTIVFSVSNTEQVLNSRRKEKEGKKEGRKEGRKVGRKEGREEGRKGGREDGRKGETIINAYISLLELS